MVTWLVQVTETHGKLVARAYSGQHMASILSRKNMLHAEQDAASHHGYQSEHGVPIFEVLLHESNDSGVLSNSMTFMSCLSTGQISASCAL